MSKLHKQAKELLQAANKVYHYRRDVIQEGRLSDLEREVAEVDTLLGAPKTDENQKTLEASMNRLDALLRKVGGKIYPKTFWSDNIEVALVAAIIVIGIRTFFFQPFIIPTNSMYPTYSGMNAVVYGKAQDGPSAAKKLLRLVTLGARHQELIAENSGRIMIPVVPGNGSPLIERVKAKKWFVLPTTKLQYTFLVDDVPHKIVLPADFSFQAVLDQYFPNRRQGPIVRTPDVGTGFAVDLGKSIQAGDPLLRFDITLGDALFVDRISYHFKRPKAGDPFVFRTQPILEAVGKATGDYTPKYYIKRIAGVGGERLEIRDYTLYADGEPRDEVEAYGRNAVQEGEYSGYINFGLLSEGDTVEIPEDSFVALGDNSGNSADSRYWGFVPDEAVIGKAFFIYYPFTKRWGIAE